MATRITLSGTAVSGFALMVVAMGGVVAPPREEQLITSTQPVDSADLGIVPVAGAMPPEDADGGGGFQIDIAGGAAEAGIDLDALLATLDEPADPDEIAPPNAEDSPVATIESQAPPGAAEPAPAQAAPPAAAEPAPPPPAAAPPPQSGASG